MHPTAWLALCALELAASKDPKPALPDVSPGHDLPGPGDSSLGDQPRPNLRLVVDGVPRATIVVPKDAHAAEQMAAEELARYVKMISGAELPVVSEGALADQAIEIGRTKAATQALAAELAQDPDGTFIEATERRLILTGGSDRGVLFAVYAFLESLGCRFLAQDVEHIPKSATLELAPTRRVSKPLFDLRTFPARSTNASTWGIKLGFNGFYTHATPPLGAGFAFLPKALSGPHAYATLIPSATYFDPHPAWFPEIDKQRTPKGQLCLTADGLAEEFAKNLCALFDDDPNLRWVSISPNDGVKGWCECSSCLSLDKKLNGGRTTKMGQLPDLPFMGDRVFTFANKVAALVEKKHPEAKLLHLAYVNYTEPPDSVTQLHSMIVPWLTQYAPGDYSRPIADPSSMANKQFNGYLAERAKRAAKRLLFYGCVSKSMWWRLPRPVLTTFATDSKYRESLGVRRYYCQSSLSNWALDGPLYYVIAKLLWDPSADPKTIAADWIKHMFGPAAAPITAFYEAVDRAAHTSGKPFSEDPVSQVPGLYNQTELDEARAQLEKAISAAGGDLTIKARVEQVQKSYLYGHHMIACLEKAAKAATLCATNVAQSQAPLAEAVAAGKKALDNQSVDEAVTFIEELTKRKLLGVCKTQGFSGEQKMGGKDCLNADETGVGDGINGWATFSLPVANPKLAATLKLEVWGTSELKTISVDSSGVGSGPWIAIKPASLPSGKAEWNTLSFAIQPAAMAKTSLQTIGLGGGDSQIWLAGAQIAQ